MKSDWMDDAACRSYRPEPGEPWPWDTDRAKGPTARRAVADQIRLAKMICSTCPVRQPCRTFGMQLDCETGVPEGIWGGEEPEERAAGLGGSIRLVSGMRRLQYEEST